jgi:hypothetical protein
MKVVNNRIKIVAHEPKNVDPVSFQAELLVIIKCYVD